MHRKTRRCLFVAYCLLLHFFSTAKESDLFGKMTPEKFALPASAIIKDANAVVLADVGSSEFIAKRNGFFAIVFKRHVRIKFLTNEDFSPATFEIPLYEFDGDMDELSMLKGTTYNLKSGALTETALKTEDVFIEKVSPYYWEKRFTMPGVVTGSIIDVEYSVTSDYFYNMRSWAFQRRDPVLWSEYQVHLPNVFRFAFIAPADNKYDVDLAGAYDKEFSLTWLSNYVSIYTKVATHTWVMKNVPPVKKEPFVTAANNYSARIDFWLNEINFSKYASLDSLIKWPSIVKTWNRQKDFAADLYTPNPWLHRDLKDFLSDTDDKLEKAKRIYAYVQDNFTCTSGEGVKMDQEDIHAVMKTKQGNASALNLLLIAMLQGEGISAYPLVLSTRQNGFTSETYPMMDRFNLTIAYMRVGAKELFLDASDPLLGFGKLDLKCYNGHSRLMIGESIPLYLEADSVKEKKTIIVSAKVGEDGTWKASLSNNMGYYQSLDLRRSIKSEGEKEWIDAKRSSSEFELLDVKIENLEKKSESLKLSYNYVLKKAGEQPDMLYLTPIVEDVKTNPFTNLTRVCPIEMPFTTDETYVATFEIPEGYAIEELPKSERVNLNEADGLYEYVTAVQEDKVMLRTRLTIKKANFLVADYQELKFFFSHIASKQKEQIVLKRIK